MPVYEYQCQDCGHQFETEQRISEPKLKDCPKCNKAALERLISATSFQLKGGGWYRDGYGSKKAGSDNDRIDRLSKAIEKDKKKSESGGGESPSAGSSSEGGGGDGGGGGGDSGSSSGTSEKSQAA